MTDPQNLHCRVLRRYPLRCVCYGARLFGLAEPFYDSSGVGGRNLIRNPARLRLAVRRESETGAE
jgi:hypothetical protein